MIFMLSYMIIYIVMQALGLSYFKS